MGVLPPIASLHGRCADAGFVSWTWWGPGAAHLLAGSTATWPFAIGSTATATKDDYEVLNVGGTYDLGGGRQGLHRLRVWLAPLVLSYVLFGPSGSERVACAGHRMAVTLRWLASA